MDEFWKALASPVWWIGVVVVGIIINLVSAYTKPALDAVLRAASSTWRARSVRAAAAYEAEMAALRKDAELQTHYRHRELITRVNAVFYALISVVMFVVQLAVTLQPEWSGAALFGWEIPNGLYYALVAIILLTSVQSYLRAEIIDLKLSRVHSENVERRTEI